MLTIKTLVKESNIPNSGLGLFADENLKKGQFIWKYGMTDYEIPLEVYNLLKEYGLNDYVDTYSTENINGSRFLDGDNCRFMNHSENPSVIFTKDFGFLSRDVGQGEELTCNYKMITTEKHFKTLL